MVTDDILEIEANFPRNSTMKVRFNGSQYYGRVKRLPTGTSRGSTIVDSIFEAIYDDCLKEKIPLKGISTTIKWVYARYKEQDPNVDLSYVSGRCNAKRLSAHKKKRLFEDKAFWNEFNYFVTLTNGKFEDENEFVAKVKNLMRNLKAHKDWFWLGVFEYGGENGRKHFHALVRIPEGTFPGKLERKKDFSIKEYKCVYRYESDYFLERLGRNDFQRISEFEKNNGNVIQYLVKYIFKCNKIEIFSNRGIPSGAELKGDPGQVQFQADIYGQTFIMFNNMFASDNIALRLRC